jgi:hypothetical protein
MSAAARPEPVRETGGAGAGTPGGGVMSMAPVRPEPVRDAGGASAAGADA